MAGKRRHKTDGKIKIWRYGKTNKAQTNEKFKISFYLAIFCVCLRPIRPPCFLKLRRSTFEDYNEDFRIILIQRHSKLCGVIIFLAAGNKKFQRAMMQMRSILPQLSPCSPRLREAVRGGQLLLLLLLCQTLTSIFKQDTHIRLIRHWECYFTFFLSSNQFPSKNAFIIENSFFF